MNLFLSIPEVRQNLYYKRKSSRITYRERFPLSRVVHLKFGDFGYTKKSKNALYYVVIFSLFCSVSYFYCCFYYWFFICFVLQRYIKKSNLEKNNHKLYIATLPD